MSTGTKIKAFSHKCQGSEKWTGALAIKVMAKPIDAYYLGRDYLVWFDGEYVENKTFKYCPDCGEQLPTSFGVALEQTTA